MCSPPLNSPMTVLKEVRLKNVNGFRIRLKEDYNSSGELHVMSRPDPFTSMPSDLNADQLSRVSSVSVSSIYLVNATTAKRLTRANTRLENPIARTIHRGVSLPPSLVHGAAFLEGSKMRRDLTGICSRDRKSRPVRGSYIKAPGRSVPRTGFHGAKRSESAAAHPTRSG